MAKKTTTIIGPALRNIPWQDKPADCTDPIWRYSGNPIINHKAVPNAGTIFNSAVVPFGGEFIGVFRVDDRRHWCNLHVGHSKDGLKWDLEPRPIKFINDNPDIKFEYGYDPRVVKLGNTYYVTWCGGLHDDPTIGMASTKDFKKFHLMESLIPPCNRNGVLFPRKIGRNYAMLNRPSDMGHTPFGNIFYCESPDLTYWGKHRFVMGVKPGWQRTKIGPGPVPIETKEGWLLIYHGVWGSCSGFVYNMGAAITDIDKPWQVKHPSAAMLMSPTELYECVGEVPNVVFPVAVLTDSATGRMAIYYGCADTVVSLAFCQVDELIAWIKKNS